MWFYNAKGELFNLATFASIKLNPVGARWVIFGYPGHFEDTSSGIQLTGELTQQEADVVMKRIAAKLEAVYEQPGRASIRAI